MPPEFAELIAKPLLLIVIFLAGVLAGMALERRLTRMRRQAWREKNRWRWARKRAEAAATNRILPAKPSVAAPKQIDATDQLRIVMAAKFTAQALLNKSEARVFKELDRMVIACNPEWQVMAQVSLGEILRSENADAYSCINSKP
ncbi:DUF2726 domain-containing protein, partial [Mesorhizobium sp. M4B.F.Ca.ET.088.02.2.1]